MPNGNYLLAPPINGRVSQQDGGSSVSASHHTQDTSKYNNYDWTNDD